MKEITELIKKYNERHPEYVGYVYIKLYDDGSGSLYFHEKRISHSGFFNMTMLRKFCEEK